MSGHENLAAGVKFFVDSLEAVLIDLCIDLCGGDIGMPQHHLHRPEIGAMNQEMGCKRMAEHVR